MKKRYSGIRRDIICAIAAVLLLSGCDTSPPDSTGGSSYSSESSSDNFEKHEESSSSEPADSSSSSKLPYSSSSSESSTSASSDNESSESPESSESSESSVNSSAQSTESSAPNSSSTIEKKPPVVIPDVAVPTSPGVKTIAAACGVVDYSNASQGYISAKYTGTRGKAKFRMEANGEVYTHDLNVNGNAEYFPLSCGNGTYKITIYEQVEGTSYSVGLQGSIDVNMPNPRAPFTYPNAYVNYNKNSQAVKKAAEVCAGKTGSIEKIAAVFSWVTSNITYDYNLAATVTSGYMPDPDRTISQKKGICYDYASLMAAMLRSQGIPSRLVKGYAASSPEPIYHAWNEVYTEQTGWITPELLLKNNGYNIVDATFYAGSNDKKQISDYISNNGNYSDLYYY